MHEGELRLQKFIVAMNEWELESYPLLTQCEANEANETHKAKLLVKKKLDFIFDFFCTKRIRKYGRQAALDCGEPPEYSPCEVILEHHQENKKLVIYTQQNLGFKSKFRYTLVYKNKEWLIDRKEYYAGSDDKWKNAGL